MHGMINALNSHITWTPVYI